MEWFSAIDWQTIFIPDTPILEIFIRGTVVYWVLFLLLRFVLKRQAGSIGLSDLLVIVLIADASQNAMAADYTSLPDGIALVCTLVFWNYAIEWLGFHSEKFEKFLHPDPLPLIKNGRMIRKHMQQELITRDELMTHLRQEGVDKVSDVKEACLEGDGKISIVKYENGK